jgi:hypothetical protein
MKLLMGLHFSVGTSSQEYSRAYAAVRTRTLSSFSVSRRLSWPEHLISYKVTKAYI